MIYKFKIIYDGFYILFRCKTINLDKAIQLAKKEAIKYSSNFTIKLDEYDLLTHIDEIISKLYRGDKVL